MRVGITGTRYPPTEAQQRTLAEEIERLSPDELHHGGCTGVDSIAGAIAHRSGIKTVCHPGLTADKWRSKEVYDETRLPAPPLDRNRTIVNITDQMIACPRSAEETGGTWYTIRYARIVGKPVTIVWPDGTLELA